MIEVSVVIPVWNAARTLERCLDAVLSQDAVDGGYEVIVVDNNSSDDSASLARGYPTVQLLAEPRQGAYSARNLGVRAAKGRLIAFTDPDCVPRRDWLRSLMQAIDDPRVLVVSGRDRPAGKSRSVRLLGEYDHVKEACVMTGSDPSAYYAHTNNLMTRRNVLDRVGPFDERARGADVIFIHRVLALWGTGAVRYEPRAHVDHLEIESAAVYFRKAFLYGRSARRYSRVVRARPLRYRERFHILRQTVRRSGLSLAEAAQLTALLVLGVGFYHLGWYRGGSGEERRAEAPAATT